MLSAALLALSSAGCNYLKSRDQLNRGVEAYKNAKYSEAVDHFKQAIQLDPNNPNARVYLATAYMNQYIPGAQSPENTRNLEAARNEFEQVLKDNPKEKLAVQSLASLSLNESAGITDWDQRLKKLDEAKQWNEKVLEIDPANKEAYYTLGVIAWTRWKRDYDAVRTKLGMKMEDPGPFKDKKAREELSARDGALIEEGIKDLQKALDIDPQYDEAMAYMNLFIRERADLRDNAEAYKQDIASADSWMNKAMETRKIKAAKAAPTAGGITPDKK
ncbi:MAG TPA: tetratricopeptide repeat protein [Bryobacteraceae bacterium]|nr:tetratricopeptide repeat protein [Bryobacteraceae bacterium]